MAGPRVEHASCRHGCVVVTQRYALLVWSTALLVPWCVLWGRCRRSRAAMLWSSFFALPFGFSEVLFAGTYWSPPTLFDLARRIHLDLESFVFLFAAGGVAAVIYEGVTGRDAPVHGPVEKRPEWREGYNAALAAPALVFPVALVVLQGPICAGIVAMGARVARPARAGIRRSRLDPRGRMESPHRRSARGGAALQRELRRLLVGPPPALALDLRAGPATRLAASSSAEVLTMAVPNGG